MWHYLYETATGRLISEASELPPELPPDTAALSREARKGEGEEWDEASRDFMAVPIPRAPIQRGTFLMRFTPAEQGAMDVAAGTRGSPASLLEKWCNYADGGLIDTMHPALRALVMGLEATGVIAAGRALEVLDGE